MGKVLQYFPTFFTGFESKIRAGEILSLYKFHDLEQGVELFKETINRLNLTEADFFNILEFIYMKMETKGLKDACFMIKDLSSNDINYDKIQECIIITNKLFEKAMLEGEQK